MSRVRLGEWDVNSDSEFYPNREYAVSSIAIHPQYHPGEWLSGTSFAKCCRHLYSTGNLYNDLALVTLQEAVDTDKFSHIGPVCLPHHAQVTHRTLQQYCNSIHV